MVRRTKEEAQATRNRLLDAAELLFVREGVSQISLQQIAQAAGATRGAIYWHFKDKADLFNAMMERVTLPVEAAIHAASMGQRGVDPLTLIENALADAMRLVTRDEQVRRVFEIASFKLEYTPEMALVQARHMNNRDACLADFERALRLAARQARLRLPIPSAAAAQGLYALISGLLQDWLLDPHRFDLESAGRRLFNVYARGLGFAREAGESAARGEPASVGARAATAPRRRARSCPGA